MDEFQKNHEPDSTEIPVASNPYESVNPPVRTSGGGFVKGLLTGIISTLVIVAILMTTIGIVYLQVVRKNSVTGDLKGDSKLDYITSLIAEYFYEDVDSAALTEGVYKGVVEGLDDPYSEYFTAQEYKDFEISTTGNYAGIGAQLSQDKDTMVVSIVKVYDGSPAEKAGLRMGDIIVSADGTEATSEELSQFVQRIRGEEGTSVELVYMRDEKEETVSVTRQSITIPSVSYRMLNDTIGYIEISDFSTDTKKEFDAAIADLQGQGMQKVIYDLRTNGGGLVDVTTEILDEILPKGTTVYMLDKNEEKTTFSSDEEHQLKIPSVVLISGNTASAAEIFSGALRDYNWATLIGTKTYGKGVVQTTFPITDGSALKLTIATYYTPKGDSIHGKGIEPDIGLEYEYGGDPDAAEYDYALDNQVQKAIEILSAE